jgi:hypothetical protein
MESKYGSEQNSPYEGCTTVSNGCMIKMCKFKKTIMIAWGKRFWVKNFALVALEEFTRN